MTTLEKLNERVEEKRLTFIQTKDKALKETILKELEDIKNEYELDNLEDIKEDLEIHKYVKEVCEKQMKRTMETKSENIEMYSNLMTSKAMINNYEQMIKQNKKSIDKLITALKGSMLDNKKN